MQKHCVALTIALTVGLLCTYGQAENYADFTLRSGFVSQVSSGETGGDIDAEKQFGNGCIGMIDESPDHKIHLSEPLTLTLTVDSTTDSTLIVQGEGSLLCDDDSAGGEDAQITAQLNAGTYAVYVGNIHQSGYYRLRLNEGEPATTSLAKSRVHKYANFKLAPGFKPNPQISGGTTGGNAEQEIDAKEHYGSNCAGEIDKVPDHHLLITKTVGLQLKLESTTDATLVISGPDGLLMCEQDRLGNGQTIIEGSFLPGRYKVHVGHLSQRGVYRLTLSELTGD